MTQKQIVLSTPAQELIPRVKQPYIDVHGLVDWCMAEVGPHEEIPPQNLLFNGGQGLGKTLLAVTLSLKLEERTGFGVPVVVFDCSEDTREYHLIGTHTSTQSGDLAFRLGAFPQAIEAANEMGCAILVAEEISALPPGTQKSFNRMTDWRNGIYIPEIGRMYKLDSTSELIIVGTMNPSSYGGVYTLNEDLRSRFVEIAFPRPSKKELETILRKTCPWASTDMRKSTAKLVGETGSEATRYTLSTRDAVNFLKSVHRHGGKVDLPLKAMLNKFEGTERPIMADRIDAVFKTKLSATVDVGAPSV